MIYSNAISNDLGLMLGCTNITCTVKFWYAHNLRMLLLYAILKAVAVPLYHIVKQDKLEEKYLNKVHPTW